ncbi:hypothetical protein [Sporosarcina psychrophila]|uniref:hypothetical protein n=1 Tax=Sporosarcina psychrophila TaxID=1476 RepID=UPI00078DD05D|nr:hypothetical protein [Sporosarcina psychrophila]AMQ04998.1 hypothetical protein AZE41_02930 [Sporosarcina psychrophila]
MRPLNTRFKRLLRLRDFDFFQVVVSDDNKTPYLLLHDEHLQTASSKGNHVAIYLIPNCELSDTSHQDILRFNDDLLGMKHNYFYFMNTLFVEEEFVFDFPYDMLVIRKYVQEILTILKNYVLLPIFEEINFNYFSQE